MISLNGDTGYILGTMHVGEFGKVILDAYKESDSLVFKIKMDSITQPYDKDATLEKYENLGEAYKSGELRVIEESFFTEKIGISSPHYEEYL